MRTKKTLLLFLSVGNGGNVREAAQTTVKWKPCSHEEDISKSRRPYLDSRRGKNIWKKDGILVGGRGRISFCESISVIYFSQPLK